MKGITPELRVRFNGAVPNRDDRRHWIRINRAPVLTLWAAVVAEWRGLDKDDALTLGWAIACFNAYNGGVSLRLFESALKCAKLKRWR